MGSEMCIRDRPRDERVQHRFRPVPAEGAEWLCAVQRAHRHSRPRREMGDRILGPEYLQQAICPGRVQLALPGRCDLGDRRLCRPAISGRPPDLLAVPRRTQDLWRDAARQILSSSELRTIGGGTHAVPPPFLLAARNAGPRQPVRSDSCDINDAAQRTMRLPNGLALAWRGPVMIGCCANRIS